MARYIKTYTGPGGESQYTGAFSGKGENLYSVPGTWEPINVCCNWKTAIAGSSITYNYNFSQWDAIKFVIHSATSGSNIACSQLFFGHNGCTCNYDRKKAANKQY
jgi:hypothetical protein